VSVERRRGYPRGPTGMIPIGPPNRGGRGYSGDAAERRLEWQMDRAMAIRAASRSDSGLDLSQVIRHIDRLQRFRRGRRLSGRLDERVGSPLSVDEREVVDVLLREGRNVTVIARVASGDPTPDIAVDGVLAEIKSSTAGNVRAFSGRVKQVPDQQVAERVFVNAVRSRIAPTDLARAMNALVSDGALRYIRIVGRDWDDECGRW
jgi:hypothetical protein